MDTVFLYDLAVETRIGLYDWEQILKQKLLFDVEIDTDFRAAAREDDIRQTVSYADVAALMREELADRDFLLLEALAEYSAELLLSRFSPDRVRIKITKPGILPGARAVGIRIERENPDLA